MGKYLLNSPRRGNAVQARLVSLRGAVRLPGMNLLFRFFAVGAMLAASVGFAADAFEGKISLNMTADRGGTVTMNYAIKGQKIRNEMTAQGHQMVSILDLAKQEMLMVMPDQGMYMVMPIKQPMEAAAGKAGDFGGDVEVTGKTETILGYKCHQILVKDKGAVTEVWAAEGLAAFTGLDQAGGGSPMAGMFGGGGGKPPAAAKWEQVLKSKGGFPLRVIARDAAGKQTMKMEATKVEPGSLPDSLFAPPAGFQKFDMPNMGGMLKGLGGE
jgi:hypothetical protein